MKLFTKLVILFISFIIININTSISSYSQVGNNDKINPTSDQNNEFFSSRVTDLSYLQDKVIYLIPTFNQYFFIPTQVTEVLEGTEEEILLVFANSGILATKDRSKSSGYELEIDLRAKELNNYISYIIRLRLRANFPLQSSSYPQKHILWENIHFGYVDNRYSNEYINDINKIKDYIMYSIVKIVDNIIFE